MLYSLRSWRPEEAGVRDTEELFDLTGRVVIVTGSTKGIGRAMVEGLASAGASVVVSRRKQDLCDQVAAEVARTTCASKAALLNLTKSMAMAWAQWNVRVNMVSPGPFMSEMMEGGERTAPGFLDLVAGGTFMKRIAKPHEIIGPVCYLVSDASSFVTG